MFKIKRKRNEDEKSIGYLFGIIEENSNKFNIQKYFLQLTSLEQIFNKFAKETERPDNQVLNMRYIDIPISNELISELFNWIFSERYNNIVIRMEIYLLIYYYIFFILE